jgi:hypothetical protein
MVPELDRDGNCGPTLARSTRVHYMGTIALKPPLPEPLPPQLQFHEKQLTAFIFYGIIIGSCGGLSRL